MLSNHYPMLYAHEYNWLILIILFVAGAVIRHFFNLRNQGKTVPALPLGAVLLLFLMAWLIAPESATTSTDTSQNIIAIPSESTDLSAVSAIMTARCVLCHSSEPNHPTAPVAPNGVLLETPAQIEQWAARIYERTVVSRTMPLANITSITEEERRVLDLWYSGLKDNDK